MLFAGIRMWKTYRSVDQDQAENVDQQLCPSNIVPNRINSPQDLKTSPPSARSPIAEIRQRSERSILTPHQDND